MSASALPETEKPASFWEDFVDILFAPARVFERRRGAGAGRVILVLAVLAGIVGAATAPFAAPLRDRAASAAYAKMRADGMSEEQIATAREFGEKAQAVLPTVGQALSVPVGILISGLLVWLVGRLLGAGSTFGFGAASLIAAYSTFPTILSWLGGGALLAVLDPEQVPLVQQPSVSPALFLGRDASPLTVAVVDVFSLGNLWSVVIVAAGLAVVARLPRQKAWTGAVILFGVGLLFAVAMGLRAAASTAG